MHLLFSWLIRWKERTLSLQCSTMNSNIAHWFLSLSLQNHTVNYSQTAHSWIVWLLDDFWAANLAKRAARPRPWLKEAVPSDPGVLSDIYPDSGAPTVGVEGPEVVVGVELDSPEVGREGKLSGGGLEATVGEGLAGEADSGGFSSVRPCFRLRILASMAAPRPRPAMAMDLGGTKGVKRLEIGFCCDGMAVLTENEGLTWVWRECQCDQNAVAACWLMPRKECEINWRNPVLAHIRGLNHLALNG